MAKNTAPLFGFEATGALGKAIVYSKWRGVPYTRRYVSPANPRSTAQVLTRSIFTMLNSFFKLAPASMVAPWTAATKGRSLYNRNAFMGQNMILLRDDTPLTSMATLRASPGSGGGAAPATVTATAGVKQISVAVTLPETPEGWTLTQSEGIAFIDQAPEDAWTGQIDFASEAVTPETLVFTGLTAAKAYVVSVWLKWQKPDGTVAYSISKNDEATPTA